MNIKAAPGFILVKPILVTKLGGIKLPDNDRRKPEKAVVIDAGTPLSTSSSISEKQLPPCKKGETVFIRQWSGTEVTVDKELYYFMSYSDIVGVIKNA